MKSDIIIRNLKLKVIIGWHEVEQLKPQTILVDIEIVFPTPPKACITDELKDTICYETLIKNIKTRVNHRTFRLIESFGHEIHQIVKQMTQAQCKVVVTKQTMIEGLNVDVSFSYGN